MAPSNGATQRILYQHPPEEVDINTMVVSHQQPSFQTWTVVDAIFRLVNRRFNAELQNPNAFPFKSLASEVKRAVSAQAPYSS